MSNSQLFKNETERADCMKKILNDQLKIKLENEKVIQIKDLKRILKTHNRRLREDANVYTYKSYIIAVMCITILAICLMPFLYFTTAWVIAASTGIAIFIFYDEYFFRE